MASRDRVGGFSTCSRIAGSESLARKVATGVAIDADVLIGELGGVGTGDDWRSVRFLLNALRTEEVSENGTFGGLGSGITIEASVEGVCTTLLQSPLALSSWSFSISANGCPWCVEWVVCARRRAVPTLDDVPALGGGLASSERSIWARRCVTTDSVPRLAIEGLLDREWGLEDWDGGRGGETDSGDSE